MYSPDGRWWWNGAQWVPVPPAAAYRTRYEETPWTRKLQVAILALQAVGIATGAVIAPMALNAAFSGTVFNSPAFQNDPQAAQTFRNFMAVGIGFGVVLALVFLVVLVIGVIKLWRWIYWYLMISYFLAVLSIPSNLAYVFGNGPIRLPAWILLIQLPLTAAELGLAILMAVAVRRYGTWARRKIVEPIPS